MNNEMINNNYMFVNFYYNNDLGCSGSEIVRKYFYNAFS